MQIKLKVSLWERCQNIMDRKKLIVGNWKMHGNLNWNEKLIRQLLMNVRSLRHTDMALCIPFPYLSQIRGLLTDTNISWGSQNVSQFDDGAYTGSISAFMIAEFGCTYAIIGHSERRALSSETFDSAANRFIQALTSGLTPIFCVGEKEDEREKGYAKAVVESQVRSVLGALNDEMINRLFNQRTIFAYEPAWAIGTGNYAQPSEADDMHAMIRSIIAEKNKDYAKQVKIIYGGSLTPENTQALLSMENIDGGLVGRCSIDAETFTQICKITEELGCGEMGK
jgi:triosephosphate isomerase